MIRAGQAKAVRDPQAPKGTLSQMQTKCPSVTTEPLYRDRIDALRALWHLEDSPRLHWVLDASPAALPLLAEGFPFAAFFQDRELQLCEELKALRWAARDKECTVINQSFHRSSEPGSGSLSYDDVYKDWLALRYPWPMSVGR